MKLPQTVLFFCLFILNFSVSFSQTLENDTAVARKLISDADKYLKKWQLDSARSSVDRSKEIYEKYKLTATKDYASVAMLLGNICYYAGQNEEALASYSHALEIRKAIFPEKHPLIADCYNNIGNVFTISSKFDQALENYSKSLEIRRSAFGEKNALVATSYNNIGVVYWYKNEYDLAIEYYTKALNTNIELFGEMHPEVALRYNNLSVAYWNKKQYEKALEYSDKSLKIRLQLYGEKHLDVAQSFNNIGLIYNDQGNYDKALEYYVKSLDIVKNTAGEEYPDVADSYANLGKVYQEKGMHEEADKYYTKASVLYRMFYGEKNSLNAINFYNKAKNYSIQGKDSTALAYFHRSACCCIYDDCDTLRYEKPPKPALAYDWLNLLDALYEKALIFQMRAEKSKKEADPNFQFAILHYFACDSLISTARKEMTTESDKMSLNEKSVEIYKNALDFCVSDAFKEYYKKTCTFSDKRQIEDLIFYFSERNKSSVLLEALAGSEALKFSGLPDSILIAEKNLKHEIARYGDMMNTAETDSLRKHSEDLLFRTKRKYDSLIIEIEQKFPRYFELKYSDKTATISEIKGLLTKNTLLLNYTLTHKHIIVLALTNKVCQTYKMNIDESLIKNIHRYRYVLQSNDINDIKDFQLLARNFYKQLMLEKNFSDKRFKSIKNLIIIPDEALSLLPFETFFSADYYKEYEIDKEKECFSPMPFLVKKYNISYVYSASLMKNTFPKSKQSELEFKKLNDWLALAPVFDDNKISGTNTVSRSILTEKDDQNSARIQKRAFLRDGKYISPLPATEEEVRSIFNLFDQNGYKAIAKTHEFANEEFIKSDSLQSFRFLHLATHGFVNIDKPELSGILLAQDTVFSDCYDLYGNVARQNDGILYQSEIYNLKLNADLVVLSACETGLGKIASGEGVIGLARALLYAGSKNIIVSLWQVSDLSTSKLMIHFYKDLLNGKSNGKFASHLRQAKLKLIESENYAHPFYWSPFILIGN